MVKGFTYSHRTVTVRVKVEYGFTVQTYRIDCTYTLYITHTIHTLHTCTVPSGYMGRMETNSSPDFRTAASKKKTTEKDFSSSCSNDLTNMFYLKGFCCIKMS